MDRYTILRQFADTWVLVLFALAFLFIIFWVFRPSAKKTYQDTAEIPFRHENKPITDKDGVK